jgi:3-methyladenine DNA glycosylase AlkD
VEPTARSLRAALRAAADPVRAAASARFFKTGKGEYAEGDVFLGVTVPEQRRLVRAAGAVPLSESLRLLEAGAHEERLVALLTMVHAFEHGDETTRTAIAKAYLAHLRWVDNWDLVDSSAPQILGTWLLSRDRKVLRRLARSKVLWERRVAILATFAFIRAGEVDDALAIAETLLDDPHDLIHKAVGWMLREVGKRVDVDVLRSFLRRHGPGMPRTALRYAIEHLPPAERKRWLAGEG